jgi:2-polyprenyl-6-methoxyphenol hydroxylase-like FAD-dependent oxidoreductase
MGLKYGLRHRLKCSIVPPSTIQGMAFDVCIRGAGVVGKTLALLLARARIRVALVQGPVHSQPDSRSFALNAASRELLCSLRAWPEGPSPVQHIKVFGDDGGSVQFDATAQGTEALAWIVDAAEIEQRLQTAISFAPEITLVNAPEPAALTVICEGARSTSRETTGLVYDVQPYYQTAIAAVLSTELPHQATAWQWMRGGAHGGEICALLPRADKSAVRGNSVALVWSVQHEHAQALSTLDEQQFCVALQHACSSALGSMQLTSARAMWPLAMAQASQWVGQGLAGDAKAAWALAGDAAHAVHPLAGQGLNLGLGDVAQLAQVLSTKPYFRSYGDQRMLRQYERARKGDAVALRLATDGLQRLFALDDSRARSLRNWGMRSFDALAPAKQFVMRKAIGL